MPILLTQHVQKMPHLLGDHSSKQKNWGEQLPAKKHWQGSRGPQMPQIHVQYPVCSFCLSSYLLQAPIFTESWLDSYKIGIYNFYTLDYKISLLGSRQKSWTAHPCLPNLVPYVWEWGSYKAFISHPHISGWRTRSGEEPAQHRHHHWTRPRLSTVSGGLSSSFWIKACLSTYLLPPFHPW